MKNVSTLLQLPTFVWSEDVDLYNDDNCCDSLVTYCQHLWWKFWYVCVWHHERLLLLFTLLLNPYQQEYVNQVSRFKLEAAIQEELGSFLIGFWKVSLNNRLFCRANSSKFAYNRLLLFVNIPVYLPADVVILPVIHSHRLSPKGVCRCSHQMSSPSFCLECLG